MYRMYPSLLYIILTDICPHLGLPSAPTSLSVNYVTRDTVTLQWELPVNTGGVPLTGYVVEQLDGNSTRWRIVSYVEPHRQFWTLHNLIQGYNYNFRVRAENSDGAGPAVCLSSNVIPRPITCKQQHFTKMSTYWG